VTSAARDSNSLVALQRDIRLVSRIAPSSTAVTLVLFLAGCAPDYSPNTYSTNAVQQANKVEQGTVVGVRQVDVLSQGTTGALAGGAAGGIVGSQAPGGGVGAAFGALGGSLIGGLVGSTVERNATDTKAFEYIVRKGSAELVSVTQKDEKPLALGQHVLVIAGNQARIVPDYTVQLDPQGAKGVEAQAAKDAKEKEAKDKAAEAAGTPPADPAAAATQPVLAPPPAVQSETPQPGGASQAAPASTPPLGTPPPGTPPPTTPPTVQP
jgi:outer membrane lipoprotein SlyB